MDAQSPRECRERLAIDVRQRLGRPKTQETSPAWALQNLTENALARFVSEVDQQIARGQGLDITCVSSNAVVEHDAVLTLVAVDPVVGCKIGEPFRGWA